MQKATKVTGLVVLALVLAAEALFIHQSAITKYVAEGVALVSAIFAWTINRKEEGEEEDE